MRHLLLFPLLFLIQSLCYAQVQSTFDEDTENWKSEGDGDFVHSENGNPGGCLRFNDDATGSFLFAVAPRKYLGDWSGTSANDSISFDLYVNQSATQYADFHYVIEIVSPAGRAEAIPSLEPPFKTWYEVSVNMDPDNWEVTSGNWEDILSSVNSFRIRVEYIHGDEYVLLDNVNLSFDPVITPLDEEVCSTFELDNLEGWTFDHTASVDLSDEGAGNPGVALVIGDQPSVLSRAYAPPKFLGDWNDVVGGALTFDLKYESSSETQLSSKNYFLQISGPGGSAIIETDSAQIAQAGEDWVTFSYPVEASSWILTDGTWQGLIDNVNQLAIEPEFINGDETVYIDNFCIAPPETVTGLQEEQSSASIELYPNPAGNVLTVAYPEELEDDIISVEIYNASGKKVQSTSSIAKQVDIAHLNRGIYTLKLISSEQQLSRRFIKE